MKKSQRRQLAAAQSVVGPSALVLAYASGAANFRITKPFVVVACVFVAAFVAILVGSGRILLPGWLLLAFAAAALQPRRGIAVSNFGVLLLHTSVWNARPDHIVLTAPPDGVAYPISTGRKVRLQIGPERVRIKKADYERLSAAIHQVYGPPPAKPEPQPFAR